MNKTLVFLHGFLGSFSEFDILIQELKKDFNCISMDLNSASTFTLKAQAEYVKEKLDTLKISKAHFWGYSMGGRVLLEFYDNYPDMCESLTLESVSLGLQNVVDKNKRIEADLEWAKLIQNDPQAFLAKWYAQDLFYSFRKSPQFAHYMLVRGETLSTTHSQMIVEASPGSNPDHHDVIENISVPTLALVGQMDQKYCDMWGKMIDQNPQIAIQIIENSGHVIHLENPRLALDHFQDFMDKQI